MNMTVTYYKNRKLYSKDANRYVNLKECKELIDAGYKLQFISHLTGQDVTEQCLKEMICKFSFSHATLLQLLKKSKGDNNEKVG